MSKYFFSLLNWCLSIIETNKVTVTSRESMYSFGYALSFRYEFLNPQKLQKEQLKESSVLLICFMYVLS